MYFKCLLGNIFAFSIENITLLLSKIIWLTFIKHSVRLISNSVFCLKSTLAIFDRFYYLILNESILTKFENLMIQTILPELKDPNRLLDNSFSFQ